MKKLVHYVLGICIFLCMLLVCTQVYARNYRQDMRDFVQKISALARQINPVFEVVPQNGLELLLKNNKPVAAYIKAVSGVGREDLFYGYEADNEPTPFADSVYMLNYCDVALRNALKVMAIDYCWDTDKVDDSYAENASRGFISFAADHRSLDTIPAYPEEPYGVNTYDILRLTDAQNFLYIINPDTYANKEAFLAAVRNTNYDVLIIDLFFDGVQLTPAEVASLKIKVNGGKRLVIAYMSIGEAEDYRYYWKKGWKPGKPSWLRKENPDWQGNYKVWYWNTDWQNIICQRDTKTKKLSKTAYLGRIVFSGFDGVYLDLVDAFEYFE